MTTPERLEEIRERVESASPEPWHFATAPHDPTTQTKAEFVVGALNKCRPVPSLWTCWAAVPKGTPDDYIIPALTGDGPTSESNARFIAHARSDVPDLLAEIAELRATLNDAHDGGNKAAKYWRELQDARRENADLAAENAELRRDLAGQAEVNSAEMDDLAAEIDGWRTQRDALLDKIRRVETALRDQP